MSDRKDVIIKLLELVKKQIKHDTRYWIMAKGMCIVIENLEYAGAISLQESKILTDYLNNNEPVQMYNTEYFFKPNAAKPRIEWLDEQIQRLQKEQQAL